MRLISRNGRDLTRRFPELAAALSGLDPPTLVLDGEIAVFDSQLVSRFEWQRARPKDDTATPSLLMAFDCLYVRAKDLRKPPLRDAGTCSKISSTASSSCSRHAGLRTTAWKRGPRCSPVGTRDWSGRMRHYREGARG